MDTMDSYKVDLKGMLGDAVSHHWLLKDNFFSAVDGPEISQGQLTVELRVKRTLEAFELTFEIDGIVKVECDRCLELMDQEIHTIQTITVKLGDEFDDDGEIIVIPESEGIIDLAWYIYEMVALEIPLRHVHQVGQCNQEVMDRLEGGREESQVDPRWAALAKLK